MHISNRIRDAVLNDVPTLVSIWHDGWHEAHAAFVSEDLVRVRTVEDFARRLKAMLPETKVAGTPGKPLGFCSIREDELMHLFVSPEARGSGAATALLRDGEARLRSRGTRVAWLACIIGNLRAARFYEREHWRRTNTMTYLAETPTGRFALDEWRYEKEL